MRQRSRSWFSNCVVQLRQKCGDSSLHIWCFPLSQVTLLLTGLSVAEEMWHRLLFVSFSANPSWAAWVPSRQLVNAHPQPSRPIAAGSSSLQQEIEICQISVAETGNFADWRENPVAGLNKHQLCTGRLARKSLFPIYSWKSSQIFNTVMDFWVTSRECKESSM